VKPIEEALAALGISMGDLTGIANCHLHFDHSGQNARLPKGVPILVQRREWTMVHVPDYTVPGVDRRPGAHLRGPGGRDGGGAGPPADPDARAYGGAPVPRR
jgi:glyoxylase-like metal-dependent hydrolase (beta-lactamase superfamily II)